MEKDKKEKEQEDNASVELLKLLPNLKNERTWGTQRVNKGTLVWATDLNGTITALTFVPD